MATLSHRTALTGERPERASGISTTTEPRPAIAPEVPTTPPASPWRASDLPQRLRWAKAFRKLLVQNSYSLCELISAEVRKTPWEAYSGDLLPLLAACRYHEKHAAKLLGPRRITGTPLWMLGQRHTTHRAPLGRVAIIATWNYPIQLLGIQMLQALIAGNDVVVKPSERAPRSQSLLIELAQHAGLPPGALESRSAARSAGQELLERERFDHIVFTGSTRVGACIARAAAETLTPTTLELSGCDSALVLADADVSLAARSIWMALTMNAGQTCMAPRRVLVEESCVSAFVAAISPLAAGARPRALIDAASADHVHALVLQTIDRGARSLTGVLEAPVGDRMRPVVLVDCPADAPLACHEHFGPALAVVPCSDRSEMLRIHRAQPQILSASIFTRSLSSARTLAVELNASIVTINDCVLPTAHPAAGISGRGMSGWGISRGPEGLLAMTRPVHISTTSPTLRPPSEEPEPSVARTLTRALTWWYGR
ncbi:MAG: aldehyde dehydrogenase family protein [Phycisphaerales bacterium]|nr:aldehyde dehydrogenase family protein [Phycisphaerales bacterium]